ncbi:MAG: urate hydroxylase PuuD [Candidatus Berkelbacteria bacterium]|nr:urate hydroxylase PuuD [Candidatus Berkelbacteria bacterium]
MDLSIFSDHGAFMLRFFHIVGGVAWIGVLWYINFIQGPFVAEVDATVQTAAKQKLFPRVMWYFRYGALLTFTTGLLLIILKGFGPGKIATMGTPVWNLWFAKIYPGFIFATIMFLNVWFVIWPRQKKIIAAANGAKIDGIPAMARRGFIASRTNTLLSIPMLFFMAAANNLTLNSANGFTVWIIAITVVTLLVEINALFANNDPAVKPATMKPLEKVSGVIHMGFVFTLLLYLGVEFVLK